MAGSSFIGLPFYAGGQDMSYNGVMPPRQSVQVHERPSTSNTHRTGQGPIPLVCHACPSNSKFSDLSHLLTHVSSKGHLSRLYYLEIMSQNDPKARDTVRRFRDWKDMYKIDYLVLQRMEARDERGIQAQSRSGTPASIATPDRRGKQPRGGGRNGGRRGRGNHGGRGSRGGRNGKASHIKSEPNTEGDGYDVSNSSWNGSSNSLIPVGGDLDASRQADYEDYEPSEDGSSLVPTEADAETGPTLKGKLFPGMDIFDSAPEEERRKRNQRKSVAVHQKLQINSTLVTTDEVIFDSNFTYQRTRDVYDDASDNESEEEEQEQEVEKKRKRRSQPRPATATKKSRHHDTPSCDGTPTMRTTRASSQATNSIGLARGQTSSGGGRMTRSARSAVDRSPIQQLLHSHGSQEEAAMFQGAFDGQNDIGWMPSSQPFAPLENQVSAETLPPFPFMQLWNSLPVQPLQFPVPDQFLESVQPNYNVYNLNQSFQPSQPLQLIDPYQVIAGNAPANNIAQTLPKTLPDDGDRSKPASIQDELTYQGLLLTRRNSHDRLPGLGALRPGNPNLSLSSSIPGFKRDPTPSQFSGKENGSLTLKTTAASSNPYLQSTDSMQGENFNPLFVESQPRNGLGFRSYASSTAGFQPINGRGTGDFDSLQMPSHDDDQEELWEIPDERGPQASSHHSASYHSTQANDAGFGY
ncbi:hypothetical protein GGR53DRAFT_528141 [Hypoxylon sp. FL1150]|nr:hypothetical protein GGR53DRAFT_528141 [Hypoxylon sp. FL1150]